MPQLTLLRSWCWWNVCICDFKLSTCCHLLTSGKGKNADEWAGKAKDSGNRKQRKQRKFGRRWIGKRNQEWSWWDSESGNDPVSLGLCLPGDDREDIEWSWWDSEAGDDPVSYGLCLPGDDREDIGWSWWDSEAGDDPVSYGPCLLGDDDREDIGWHWWDSEAGDDPVSYGLCLPGDDREDIEWRWSDSEAGDDPVSYGLCLPGDDREDIEWSWWDSEAGEALGLCPPCAGKWLTWACVEDLCTCFFHLGWSYNCVLHSWLHFVGHDLQSGSYKQIISRKSKLLDWFSFKLVSRLWRNVIWNM